MKRTTVLTALALTLLTAGLALPAVAQDAEAVPTPAVEAQAAELGALACDAVIISAPVLEQSAVWSCPYGAPFCYQHDDCDAYCGDPRFGWCFSNGCCGCSG